MKLTKRLQEIGVFFELLSEGKPIDEISEIMGLDADELLKLKTETVREKSNEIKNKPIEHVYFEYFLNQLENIRELSELIRTFDGNSRNYPGIVSAIRLRSDIYDKIIDKGQSLGVIKKTANRTENHHNILIAELSSNELREAIVKQYAKLAKFTSFTGNDNIINIPIDDIYSGEAKPLTGDVVIEHIEHNEKEYQKPIKRRKAKRRKAKKENE